MGHRSPLPLRYTMRAPGLTTRRAPGLDESQLPMPSTASRLKRDAGVVPVRVGAASQESDPRRHPPDRRPPPGMPTSSGRALRSPGQGRWLAACTGGALSDRKAGATGRRHHDDDTSSRTTRAARTTRRAERTQPLEPSPTPDLTSAVRTTPNFLHPDPPPAPRVSSTAHPPAPHLLTRHPSSAALDPIAAAPPPAHPLPPGQTHPGLPGRSRKGSPARSGGLPFLQSPGAKPRKHPEAGRRPVALMGKTHRAKHMEGNT